MVTGSESPQSGSDVPPSGTTSGTPPSGVPEVTSGGPSITTNVPPVSGSGVIPTGTEQTGVIPSGEVPGVTGTPSQTVSGQEASGTRPGASAPLTSGPPPSFTDEPWTPTQTQLVINTESITVASDLSAATTGTIRPTVASIPSSVATIIVPLNTVQDQPNYNTGRDDDPVKDMTLVSILLNLRSYPWMFVVNNYTATGQLLDTFPTLISTALEIDRAQVKTVGLEVYQPTTWDGSQATLGTQYLGYIPNSQFNTLEAYISTSSSPIYNQTGVAGSLAAQIDSSYPISSASTLKANAQKKNDAAGKSSSRTRNIIIGVCVGVGGLLWILLVVWIYKRVKRANEKTVNKRLSEHMSMFSGRSPGENPFNDDRDRRLSTTPSIAASEIDDRPSSFYASPLENYPAMRHRQVESYYTDQAGVGDTSPTSTSVFGNSWLNTYGSSTTARAPSPTTNNNRASQNPFDDMYSPNSPYARSPTSPRMSARPQRRSVQKGMISQPTLQGNSLEFSDYRL